MSCGFVTRAAAVGIFTQRRQPSENNHVPGDNPYWAVGRRNTISKNTLIGGFCGLVVDTSGSITTGNSYYGQWVAVCNFPEP